MADLDSTDELARLKAALQTCDMFTQGATEAIQAMAKGARQLLLDLDRPGSLLSVRTLLLEIESRAGSLSDDINCEAESHGANFVDRERREVDDTVWQRWHARAEGPGCVHQ